MDYSNVPSVIKDKNRWLLYKNDAKGYNCMDLYSPKHNRKVISSSEIQHGTLANAHYTEQFGTFAEIIEISRKRNAYSGIAYVLDVSEYALIIENAIDSSTNEIFEWTQGLVELMGSYTERSMTFRSNDSILILFTANEEMLNKAGFDHFKRYFYGTFNGTLKMYSEFVPITGQTINQYDGLNDCTDVFGSESYKLINTSLSEGELFLSLSPHKSFRDMPIDSLVEFSEQPFKPYEGERLDKMVKSIQTHGVLVPITVRPHPSKEDAYEIISGHNRVRAAKEARLKTIPAIIDKMDDDAAILVMVETNFKHRHDLSFSEKAFAYKLKNDVYKRQGKRNDLYGDDQLSDPRVTKSSDIIGMDEDKSGRTVYRYIRLTELINEFLLDVDAGNLGFKAAVALSYLLKDEQEALYSLLKEKNIKVTQTQANALKKAKDNNEELTTDRMLEILNPEKSKETIKINTVRLPFKDISHFFEGEDLSEDDINNRIIEALEYYRQNKE